MPAQDGTGPMGQGPMTGRGAGPCRQTSTPGQARQGRGFGPGFGQGFGRGRRRGGFGCGRGMFGRQGQNQQ